MGELTGRVVVVAGQLPGLGDAAAALAAAGAFVAIAAPARHDVDVAASFATDPADPVVWERVAPHVEQRLGPVDAVVTDATCADLLRTVFEPDMRRRGHGSVVVIDDTWSGADVVGAVSISVGAGTPPAASS